MLLRILERGKGFEPPPPPLASLCSISSPGCVGARKQVTSQAACRHRHSLRGGFVHYMFYSAGLESVLRNEPLCPIRSSSRKKPARQRTSAPPLVLVTET